MDKSEKEGKSTSYSIRPTLINSTATSIGRGIGYEEGSPLTKIPRMMGDNSNDSLIGQKSSSMKSNIQAIDVENEMEQLKSNMGATVFRLMPGTSTLNVSKDKSKGLREFSWRVCTKVEEKGYTSYNEVADELVQDMAQDDPTYDQKNIRRRVYDALNVLMAIDVIAKDKKLIRWIGLPSGARQELNDLEREKRELLEAVALKRRIISERLRNEVAIRRLILRNKKLDHEGQLINRATVKLPFLLLHVPKDAVINGYVTQDGRILYIRFDKPFQIHDDVDLMRLMGLYKAPLNELHALISENFRPFITDDFYTTH